jgi:hypothetical protein
MVPTEESVRWAHSTRGVTPSRHASARPARPAYRSFGRGRQRRERKAPAIAPLRMTGVCYKLHPLCGRCHSEEGAPPSPPRAQMPGAPTEESVRWAHSTRGVTSRPRVRTSGATSLQILRSRQAAAREEGACHRSLRMTCVCYKLHPLCGRCHSEEGAPPSPPRAQMPGAPTEESVRWAHSTRGVTSRPRVRTSGATSLQILRSRQAAAREEGACHRSLRMTGDREKRGGRQPE